MVDIETGWKRKESVGGVYGVKGSGKTQNEAGNKERKGKRDDPRTKETEGEDL